MSTNRLQSKGKKKTKTNKKSGILKCKIQKYKCILTPKKTKIKHQTSEKTETDSNKTVIVKYVTPLMLIPQD